MIDLNAAAAAKAETGEPTADVMIGDEKFTVPAKGALPFMFAEHLSSNNIDQALQVLFGEDYERFIEQRPTLDQISALIEGITKDSGFDTAGESQASGKRVRGTTTR